MYKCKNHGAHVLRASKFRTMDRNILGPNIWRVGTAVAQWLRYCATNQKVVGSIPDGVMEFFIHINPSDRTMAHGSTQPLRNAYQVYFLGFNAAGA
jgi:hypothetical protein